MQRARFAGRRSCLFASERSALTSDQGLLQPVKYLRRQLLIRIQLVELSAGFSNEHFDVDCRV